MATADRGDPRRPIAMAVRMARAMGNSLLGAALLLGSSDLLSVYIYGLETSSGRSRHWEVYSAGVAALLFAGVGAVYLYLADRLKAGKAWAAVWLTVAGIGVGLPGGFLTTWYAVTRLASERGSVDRLVDDTPLTALFVLLLSLGSVGLAWFGMKSIRASVDLAPSAADRLRGFEPVVLPNRLPESIDAGTTNEN